MISIKSNRVNGIGMLFAVIIGTAAAIVVCVIGALIGPLCILNEYLEPRSVAGISLVIQGVGAFISATIAFLIVNDRKWLAAGISAGMAYALLTCIGVAFFESDPAMLIEGFLSCAIGGMCSELLLNRKKNSSKRKKNKRRSR